MSCPICLDTIDDTCDHNNVYTTICKHKMHRSCLLNWCNVKEDSCPVCRGKLYYSALSTKAIDVPLSITDNSNINKLYNTDLSVESMIEHLDLYNFIRYNRLEIPSIIMNFNNDQYSAKHRYLKFIINKKFKEQLLNDKPIHWIEINRINTIQLNPVYKFTLDNEIINLFRELNIFEDFTTDNNYIYIDNITRFVLLYYNLNINHILIIFNNSTKKESHGIEINSFLNINRLVLSHNRFYLCFYDIVLLNNLNSKLLNYIYDSISNNQQCSKEFISLFTNSNYIQTQSDIYLNLILRRFFNKNYNSLNIQKIKNMSDEHKHLYINISIYMTLTLHNLDQYSSIFNINIDKLKSNSNYIPFKKSITRPKRNITEKTALKYSDLLYNNDLKIWIDDYGTLI